MDPYITDIPGRTIMQIEDMLYLLDFETKVFLQFFQENYKLYEKLYNIYQLSLLIIFIVLSVYLFYWVVIHFYK